MNCQRTELYPLIQQAKSSLNHVILGQENSVDLALAGLLSGNHFIIEGAGGCGKTTLGKALTRLIDANSLPTQLHDHISPTDLLQPTSNNKSGHIGPMAQTPFIAEDISNSAENIIQIIKHAMTEQRILINANPINLPDDFQIIATELLNTSLPTSLYDRFLLRITMQALKREPERLMFREPNRELVLNTVQPIFTQQSLTAIRQAIKNQYASPHLLDHIQNIIEFTHDTNEFAGGLSSHGALALLQSARAYSFLQARDHVLTEDVQAVLAATVNHRLTLNNTSYNSPTELINDKVLLYWWALG